MIPEFHLCDVCSARIPMDTSIFVAYGTEMDPSGNGYNSVGDEIELCNKCWPLLVKRMLRRRPDKAAPDYDLGQHLLDELEILRERKK